MDIAFPLFMGIAIVAVSSVVLRQRARAIEAEQLLRPDDRRRSQRHSVRPLAVTVVGLGFRVSAQRAFVLDRSSQGVRLAMADRISVGALIQVRAVDARDDVDWQSAVVRNGRYVGDYYEAGCELI